MRRSTRGLIAGAVALAFVLRKALAAKMPTGTAAPAPARRRAPVT
ncbi:hypothetical protein NYE39_14450 [Janibacter sp. FSL W8-0316]